MSAPLLVLLSQRPWPLACANWPPFPGRRTSPVPRVDPANPKRTPLLYPSQGPATHRPSMKQGKGRRLSGGLALKALPKGMSADQALAAKKAEPNAAPKAKCGRAGRADPRRGGA